MMDWNYLWSKEKISYGICSSLFISQDGMWNDEMCEYPSQGFICKAPKSIISSAVLQPNTAKGCPGVSFNCKWLDVGTAIVCLVRTFIEYTQIFLLEKQSLFLLTLFDIRL